MPRGKIPQRILVNAGGAPLKGNRSPWSAPWPDGTRRERAKASAQRRDVSDKSTALRGYPDQRLEVGSLKAVGRQVNEEITSKAALNKGFGSAKPQKEIGRQMGAPDGE